MTRTPIAGALLLGMLAGCVSEFPAVGPVSQRFEDAALDARVDAQPGADGAAPDMADVDGAPGADAGAVDAGPCVPADETCNGVDDDCDGRVDEQQPRQACALTAGVCAGDSAGCIDGSYAACDHGLANANFEADETRCDGLDNDCDGRTDEACACEPGESQACGLSAGVCRAGTQQCADGTFGPCEGAFEGGPEVCNSLDDDCDGDTDEDLPTTRCQTDQPGVCAPGEQQCGQPCVALVAPEAEICDGLDNDCDGDTDEEVPARACLVNPDRPECGEGETRCVDGAVQCWRDEDGRADATCDGLDDDCDGRTDEDYVATPCAMAACGGMNQCTDGVERCVLTPVEAVDVGFNDVDEDCDGEVDEGPVSVYLEDLLVGGDGRRPGLPRAYVSGYDELSVRGSGGFNPAASPAPAVDWVFRPNRQDGQMPITSTALTYDFSADVNSDESWTPPAKGPLSYAERPSPLNSAVHVIELHANIGVTFDLDAIRAQHPDRTLLRFRGRLGSSDRGHVRVQMLIDANVHYTSDCQPRDNANESAVETINQVGLAGRRFLTFVALDCDNDDVHNRHGFLWDARVDFGDRRR